MKVTLKRGWFAPTLARVPNKLQTISGRMFPKGTYTMPNEYRDALPKDAIVHGDKPKDEKPKKEPVKIDPEEVAEEGKEDEDQEEQEQLADNDLGKAITDQMAKAEEEAEAQIAKNEANKKTKAAKFQKALAEKKAKKKG